MLWRGPAGLPHLRGTDCQRLSPCRVEELGLAPQAEAAIVRFARDDTVAVKVAAAAAAAGLVAGQLSDRWGRGADELGARDTYINVDNSIPCSGRAP